MSISLIFPISMGGNSGVAPHSMNPDGNIVYSDFGAGSYADWQEVLAIKQNLKMLLLTRKGEYVMDQNYGVGLPEYLFDLHTDIDLSSLESKIFAQASEYMPYLTISNLVISTNPEQNILNIKMEFFYNGNEVVELFELEVI